MSNLFRDNLYNEFPDPNKKIEEIGEQVEDAVDNMEILSSFSINAKAFGAVGNNTDDDSDALQKAIDYAIQNKNRLEIPQGEYKTTKQLIIWGSLHLVGAKGKVFNKPTVINYSGTGTAIKMRRKDTVDGPFVDKELGGCFLEHINVQRSFSNDNGLGTSTFGSNGYGFELFNVSEGAFDKVGVTGFKVGIHCQAVQIFDFNKCDVLHNKYGLWLRKTSEDGTTERNNLQINVNMGNFYMNDEAQVMVGGTKNTFFECHMEQSKCTFLFDGTVNNSPLENILIQAGNYRNHDGNMNTSYTDSRIIKFISSGATAFQVDNVRFLDNFCKLKGANAVPIDIVTNGNANMTVYLEAEANTFYGAPLGIIKSDSIYQPEIKFGHARIKDELGANYGTTPAIAINGRLNGVTPKYDRNEVYGVIQLGSNTQVTEKEGALYYDYTGHVPKVRGQNRTQVLLPVIYGTAAPTSGTYSLGDMIINVAVSRTKNISHWLCITAGSTGGTWRAFGTGNGTTAERPTLATGDAGYAYFDTDLAKIIVWSGSAWLA